MRADRTAPTVALIPIRAGSKGLPGKNTRLLAGRPLYRHAIEHAVAAGIERIAVSTDIDSVLSDEADSGVELLERPDALAADDTTMDAVLAYILEHDLRGPATIVLLQATTPLRDPADIERCIALFRQSDFDLVMTVTQADRKVLKWGLRDGERYSPLRDPSHCFANRASLPEVFRPDGAVFVFDADWFRRNGSLGSAEIGSVVVPGWRADDVDTIEDFLAVERKLSSE